MRLRACRRGGSVDQICYSKLATSVRRKGFLLYNDDHPRDMVSVLKRRNVSRSQVASLNPLTYEDGLSICEFFTPSSKYFGRQVVPIKHERKNGSRSFMAPIAHFHLLQNEQFYVESGRGIWYMQGKKIHLKAGDSLTIPRCIGHRFENDPDSLEPLAILVRKPMGRMVIRDKWPPRGYTSNI